MRSRFSLLILCFLSFCITIKAQTRPENHFNEMKTAFLLGLDAKGLDICHDILTKDEYSAIKPQTLYFIAEYFFYKGIADTIEADKVNRAYYFYNALVKDFPSSEYSRKAEKRIDELKKNNVANILFGEALDEYEIERRIVYKKFQSANTLIQFHPISGVLFLNDYLEADPIFTVNKYLDDIIVNNPKYEIYGYYYKILSYLDQFSRINILSQTIIPYDKSKIYSQYKSLDKYDYFNKYNQSEWKKIDQRMVILDSLINVLDQKYPKHPITLDLHFIYSQVLMKKLDDRLNQKCFKHLNYILKNDDDKVGLRYVLSKELVLNNKFEQ